jgi:SAM-dependent methyltransferase
VEKNMNKSKVFYEDFYKERIKRTCLRNLFEVSEYLINHNIKQLLTINRVSGAKLIDVGCGRGQTTKELAAFGEVTGVDISSVAVEACQKRYPNISFSTANILDPEWITEHTREFDVVVSTEVIEHIPKEQQQLYVHHLRELLRPGGLLILTTPNRPVIDLMKPNDGISNSEFYIEFEKQPVANLLSMDELIALQNSDDTITEQLEISPLIRPRPLDLLLKLLTLPSLYVWLQTLQGWFNLPGKVAIICVRRTNV